MSLPALYELAADYRHALEKLADLDLPEEVVQDTLEALKGEVEVKATNVAAFIRNLEALAEQIRQAEARMAERRKAIESRAERVRQYLLANMQACGITKIESPWFAIAIRKNSPSVEIVDEAAIPPELMIAPPPPPPKPNKEAIKALLKAGQEVPGARLSQGVRVEIR
ncbi:MAG: siphovirus Gp157 family protein [Desulfacinum sp.]|nr:siphovirus Gp157 family protein [Desulfacinum sp.]